MNTPNLTRSSVLVLAAAAALSLAACGKKDVVDAPMPTTTSPSSSMSTPSTTSPSDNMTTPATGTAGTASPDTSTMGAPGATLGGTPPGGLTGSSGTLSNNDGSTSTGTPGMPVTPSLSDSTTTTR